jgi:hypothetical protein
MDQCQHHFILAGGDHLGCQREWHHPPPHEAHGEGFKIQWDEGARTAGHIAHIRVPGEVDVDEAVPLIAGGDPPAPTHPRNEDLVPPYGG